MRTRITLAPVSGRDRSLFVSLSLVALAAGCARSPRTNAVAITTVSVARGAAASSQRTPPTQQGAVVGARSSLRLAPEIQCAPPAQRGARAVATHEVEGNPNARRAAQRGLSFVSQDAARWQSTHQCFGCHVQAVTLEAMSVGRGHHYEVDEQQLRTVLSGMLDIRGGHRRPRGLGVGDEAGMPATSNAFGGAAFARFDTLVDGRVRDDLLGVSQKLLSFQNEDGSVRADDTRFPVVAGSMQATTQALQTWRVAYDRSANPRWLDPMRRAEAWLQRRARQIADDPSTNITEINYAVFGLIAAGAMPSEPILVSLGNRLRSRQNNDGGWGFVAGPAAAQPQAAQVAARVVNNIANNSTVAETASSSSSPFATGQAAYALRLLGASDSDRAVARATSFLMERQQADGGWSHGGAGRAEAMWAVFGLVSVDVLSLDVRGVRDGQHAQGALNLQAIAVDNSDQGVSKVEIVVDDVPVQRSCGANASFSLDTAQLASGVHSVDVVATNARGQQSRRRVEFYTGTHYLSQLAARFQTGTTQLSWRSVAPSNVRGDVRVSVYSTRVEAGSAVRDREVWTSTVPNAEGPMSVAWNGHDRANAALPEGRYVAEVSFVSNGAVVHRQETLFAHEDPEAQARRYATVEGSLALPGSGNAANTEVELVDDRGNVVQRTTTTAQGNYQFSNVDTGRYRVRVNRQGFRSAEQSVQAVAPAAAGSRRASPARADVQLAW
ncbi:MAG: carboxypeptidase regulatory-like domain-containing protein [Polyangiales bacterium]